VSPLLVYAIRLSADSIDEQGSGSIMVRIRSRPALKKGVTDSYRRRITDP